MADPTTGPATIATPGAPPTVLVVDDNPVTRYATARMLRAAGFATQEAESGQQALLQAGAHTAAVVLDVNLPDIDGFEVCRRLRERPGTTTLPVVHLTAKFLQEQDKVKGLDAGANAYLTHPAEPAVLIATVAALIRAGEAERAMRELARQREQLIEREQAARAAMERLNRMKDEFIAILSHELRNPLNVISLWTHVLERQVQTEEGRRGLAAIQRNVEIQQRLVADLLDVSRFNVGKIKLDGTLARPYEEIQVALQSMQGQAAEKRITIVLETTSLPEAMWLDTARFQQILWNLLSNAIKFSPEGSEVRVQASGDGQSLRVRVTDMGRGIAPELLPVLFERFTQGDDAGQSRSRGLGLGLSIVKDLTEMHGGTVQASSPGLGLGSTFEVVLPVRLQAPEGTEQEEETPAVAGLTALDVLLVEDDVDSASALSAILQGEGATVRLAGCYEDALDQVALAMPDLIISDIGLPGADGFALMREIRRLEAAEGAAPVPAIALTAFTRQADRRMAVEAGFDAVCGKPLNLQGLMSSARAVLLRRRG